MVMWVSREHGRSWQFREENRIGSNRYSKLRMIRRPDICGRTGTKRRCSVVSPSEGNEVRRKDCQEVAASHSTDEPGEPSRGTLRREGDATSRTVGGKHARYAET